MRTATQPKREYKQTSLKSPGLEILNSIHDVYGPEYDKDKENGGYYTCCLSTCGKCQASVCCLCSTCGCGPLKEVTQGHLGLRVEFGKIKGKMGPGLHTYNPCSEKIILVDQRVQSLNVKKQCLLTKDSVTVYIDVFVNYKIAIPEYAIYMTSNYYELLNLIVQAVMKTIVAERTLSQLLLNRKEIEKATNCLVDERAHPYGVDVVSIETQSIQLPHTMERAMATVAESEKRSEAKVISAKGNLESAKIFREASDELSKNIVSLELQYFETLKAIAMENPSTLVVPDSVISSVKSRK